MNTKPIPSLLALVASLAFTLPVIAAQPGLSAAKSAAPATPAGRLAAPNDSDAAWLAQARASYPLKTCLVSQEELGGMGKPADFIYRQEGQPDRLVRFCCKSCIEDFEKEPAKFLQRIDEAGKSAH